MKFINISFFFLILSLYEGMNLKVILCVGFLVVVLKGGGDECEIF